MAERNGADRGANGRGSGNGKKRGAAALLILLLCGLCAVGVPRLLTNQKDSDEVTGPVAVGWESIDSDADVAVGHVADTKEAKDIKASQKEEVDKDEDAGPSEEAAKSDRLQTPAGTGALRGGSSGRGKRNRTSEADAEDAAEDDKEAAEQDVPANMVNGTETLPLIPAANTTKTADEAESVKLQEQMRKAQNNTASVSSEEVHQESGHSTTRARDIDTSRPSEEIDRNDYTKVDIEQIPGYANRYTGKVQAGKFEEDEDNILDAVNFCETVKHNLLIYCCGSDLETRNGDASDDILSIVNSGFDQNNLNVIVIVGGAKEWHNPYIKSLLEGNDSHDVILQVLPNKGDKIQLNEMDGTYLKPLAYSDASMGNAETVTGFVDFVDDNFPAEKESLIFWNHGGGITGGICWDENFSNDEEIKNLRIEEIYCALNSTKESHTGKNKYEWIGCDACAMANIEIMDAVTPFANFYIGSEEVEVGGWQYDAWDGHDGFVKAMSDTSYSLDKVLDEIVYGYDKLHAETKSMVQTLSVMDLQSSAAKNVCVSVDTLARKLLYFMQDNPDKWIQKALTARQNSFDFGLDKDRESSMDFIDLKDYALQLQKEFSEENEDKDEDKEYDVDQYEEIRDAAQEVIRATEKVVYRHGNDDGYKDETWGLMIYHPYYAKYNETYTAYDNIPAWKTYVRAFNQSYTRQKFDEDPWDLVEYAKSNSEDQRIDIKIKDGEMGKFMEHVEGIQLRFLADSVVDGNSIMKIMAEAPYSLVAMDRKDGALHIDYRGIQKALSGNVCVVSDGTNTQIQTIDSEDDDQYLSAYLTRQNETTGTVVRIYLEDNNQIKVVSDQEPDWGREIEDLKGASVFFYIDQKVDGQATENLIKLEDTSFSLDSFTYELSNSKTCYKINKVQIGLKDGNDICWYSKNNFTFWGLSQMIKEAKNEDLQFGSTNNYHYGYLSYYLEKDLLKQFESIEDKGLITEVEVFYKDKNIGTLKGLSPIEDEHKEYPDSRTINILPDMNAFIKITGPTNEDGEQDFAVVKGEHDADNLWYKVAVDFYKMKTGLEADKGYLYFNDDLTEVKYSLNDTPNKKVNLSEIDTSKYAGISIDISSVKYGESVLMFGNPTILEIGHIEKECEYCLWIERKDKSEHCYLTSVGSDSNDEETIKIEKEVHETDETQKEISENKLVIKKVNSKANENVTEERQKEGSQVNESHVEASEDELEQKEVEPSEESEGEKIESDIKPDSDEEKEPVEEEPVEEELVEEKESDVETHVEPGEGSERNEESGEEESLRTMEQSVEEIDSIITSNAA